MTGTYDMISQAPSKSYVLGKHVSFWCVRVFLKSAFALKKMIMFRVNFSLYLALTTSVYAQSFNPMKLTDLNTTQDGIQNTMFKVLSNNFYFYNRDSLHGLEMWISNGSPAGTRLLKDSTPGLQPTI